MSSVDVRLAVLASPARALSLLTVRAAISSALSSGSPRSSRPSLMCSYWRSRLLFHARCGMYGRYPTHAAQKRTRRRDGDVVSAGGVVGRAALHGAEGLGPVTRLDLVLVDDCCDDRVADVGVRRFVDRRGAAPFDVDPAVDRDEGQGDGSPASVHQRTAQLVDREPQILDVLDRE